MSTEQAPASPNTQPTRRSRRKLQLRIIASVLLVIIVAVAAAVAIFMERLRADPIPLGAPSGELAFMSNRDGNWDIFILKPDGTLTNMTPSLEGEVGDADYFASWAFSGDMVNFLTNRSGVMGVGQVAPDGSELRTLSELEAIRATVVTGRLDWDPAWSPPDASRLLWASLRDLNLELYVMDGNDTDTMTRLTRDAINGPRDWFMAWSPDGTEIVYSSSRSGNEEIYIMNADGTNIRRLTDSEGDDLRAVYSQDGQTILFVSERENPLASGQMDLYLMDVDGGNQRPLGDEIFTGGLMYASDGQEVAYISNESGRWNIYLMNVDGSNVRRLTDDQGDDLFPMWRPVPLEDNE